MAKEDRFTWQSGEIEFESFSNKSAPSGHEFYGNQWTNSAGAVAPEPRTNPRDWTQGPEGPNTLPPAVSPVINEPHLGARTFLMNNGNTVQVNVGKHRERLIRAIDNGRRLAVVTKGGQEITTYERNWGSREDKVVVTGYRYRSAQGKRLDYYEQTYRDTYPEAVDALGDLPADANAWLNPASGE